GVAVSGVVRIFTGFSPSMFSHDLFSLMIPPPPTSTLFPYTTLIQSYGANRTGRFAGRLIQVQNLPQNHISDLNEARALLKQGNFEALQILYESVPSVLSQLIRTAFVPIRNNRFIIVDFSAIEARVIAWIAGETWRNEVFASHGKIYEA